MNLEKFTNKDKKPDEGGIKLEDLKSTDGLELPEDIKEDHEILNSDKEEIKKVSANQLLEITTEKYREAQKGRRKSRYRQIPRDSDSESDVVYINVDFEGGQEFTAPSPFDKRGMIGKYKRGKDFLIHQINVYKPKFIEVKTFAAGDNENIETEKFFLEY